jgi:hypothetical protein
MRNSVRCSKVAMKAALSMLIQLKQRFRLQGAVTPVQLAERRDSSGHTGPFGSPSR